MTKNHLRLVATTSEPCPVSQLETFSFARVGDVLIIQHGDARISADQALARIRAIIDPTTSEREQDFAAAEVLEVLGAIGGFSAMNKGEATP